MQNKPELPQEILQFLETVRREGVNKYKCSLNGDGLEDLSQQSFVLMFNAAARFSGDFLSPAFIKFARQTILGGLAAFVLGGDVSIPASTRYEYNKILKTRKELETANGFTPSFAEVAEACGATPGRVRAAVRYEILLGPALKELQNPDNYKTFLGSLKDPEDSVDSCDKILVEQKVHLRLSEELDKLTATEKAAIQMILRGSTMTEIGAAFGRSEKYARMIRKSAFRKLRKSRELKELFDSLAA